ncbi:MAG: phosphoribosylamine--glycine ligase [Microgenomates group bacterium Gr01-1014_7]|nr:MAG: phosphoribosylamine--glycine ligase [Microgenomates group bacterium Gr01-1014_7]
MMLFSKKKIAILISDKGTGTNLQAIIDGVIFKKINAKIISVISDTKDAFGLKRAKKYKLPVKIVPKKEDLLPTLKKLNPDYICLAGWKQIILEQVLDNFPNRILNTHPGLIPDTLDGVVKNPDGTNAIWNKGKMTDKAIQNFINSKSTYAGCTNHFLSHEFDFGPVLGRCFEKIKKGDTVKSLYRRLKVKENKLYVDVLVRLCKKDGQKVLVVDGGGRGAALVDKYAQSEKVFRILAVPGNDLMQINTKKEVKIFPNLKTTDIYEILEICKKEKIDLVDVAQDNAVEAGLVDTLMLNGIPVIGPISSAGQIEWDKAWARKFMGKYSIPAPKYQIFYTEKEGKEYVKNLPAIKCFVKASGLAEGKGAIPANNKEEAINAIKQMSKFGRSGDTYLLEEWLKGEEFSAFALCDGENFQIVGYAQDHKRVFDQDLGPNTGGMGCVSNPLIVDKSIKKQVEEIFRKTVNGLKDEGRPYMGVLYLGVMVVKGKVLCLEFNARWGDPEAQVIIPGVKNDFIEIADAIIYGKIKNLKLKMDKQVRVALTATAKGYPVDYSDVKGKKIYGIENALRTGVKIYGAGIKKVNSNYVVAGGRVFHLVAEGKDILEARHKAYKAMKLINIEGNNLHYRTDIGWRDLERFKK